MKEAAFLQAALAVVLGMAAQALAIRWAVPSIVLLLGIGVLCGPEGLGLLDPGAFTGARAELVSLAVTVILFEGGLALRVEELRQQQKSLFLLLTVGGFVSMTVATFAAHHLAGLDWPIATLYGALMIVTGPTVVTPLLSRLTLDRTTRELLIAEAVLIDPLGAIIAIVAADYVMGHSGVWQAGWLVLARLGVGSLLGAVAGVGMAGLLRREAIPEAVRNPAVLASVLLVAALASRLSSEAGLMAAVVQGAVMGNAGLRQLGPLRQFKEEITLLLLSFLFVVLAADLPIADVRALGWEALLVVAALAWVARPLAVLLCTVRSSLTMRQRLFVSWICPRGIVAASVAGLFAIWLGEAEIPGGERLRALVFVTVALTVTLQGLTAAPIARLLGLDRPALRGTLIVGADQLGRLLGRLLTQNGRQAALIDYNPEYCRIAHAEGLPAYNGDALEADALEEAGAAYAGTVLAMTRNQELNALIAHRVRENFRVDRMLTVTANLDTSSEARPFPGNRPGLDEVNLQIRVGNARLVEYAITDAIPAGRALGDLPYGSSEFALVVARRDSAYVATAGEPVVPGDRLLCLRIGEAPSPLESLFACAARRP